MKKAIIYLAVGLTLALPAAGDFADGLKAYQNGDYATALKEWRPLAEKGDANAEYNMGLLYAKGEGVAQDYKQAIEWYQKAAEQGVAAAQFNLGVIYANGEGVTADPEQARKWFSQAAQHGIHAAESNMADLYSESKGFQNYGEAATWYRKAAERGIASAEFELGVMYDLGQGVQQNYEEAIKWYRQAADQGYAPAMTNLGILYYNQQGVKRDLVQAYAWFGRAAKAGDPRAPKLLRIAAGKMGAKQVQQAQQVAMNWQPQNPSKSEADRIDEAALFTPRPSAETEAAVAAKSTPMPALTHEEAAPAPAPTNVQDVWTGVERVVAVGDVHGDYEQFVAVLRSADLIDDQNNWSGGKTHLVQTGDVVDRGPDSRRIMDLLMKLEEQAAAAGGAVHALIGNHEAMDMYGDLRFVSPGEYAAFRDGESGLRDFPDEVDREALTAPAKPEAGPVTNAVGDGYAAYRAAFAPSGKYGKWISGHNAVVKINDTLFVHAGIGPKFVGWSIHQINQQVRAELRHVQQLHGGIVTDADGPLWYRGLAEGHEGNAVLDAALGNYGVKRIVVGHTYAGGAIMPLYGGKVILVDIGLSRIYDNTGKIGCLVIENGNAYALHRGRGLALPRDNGPDMLRYLRQAAALDPAPSPLQARIAALQAGLASSERPEQ